MRLLAALITVVTFASSAFAAPQVLSIAAQGGAIRITPIFHGSLQIEYRGKVIHVDPFSQGNYSKAKKAGWILITHTHPDHLDVKAIRAIAKDKISLSIIAPKAAVPQLHAAGYQDVLKYGEIVTLDNYEPMDTLEDIGQKKAALWLRTTAVPAYNLKRGPKPGQKFHPKGQFNGYILTLGGKRIYIAGDTEATPEMKQLKNIDVAFLPMNLPYTMTPFEAANAARAFKPKMAVPYHYRYPFDKPNTHPQQFQKALHGTKIQVKLFDWYAR